MGGRTGRKVLEMPIDLVGAAVGCLVRLFSGASVVLVRGPEDERALRAAVHRAIDVVVAQAEPSSRDRLREGLRHCFAAHGPVELDGTLTLGDGVRAAVAGRIACLAEMIDLDGPPFHDDLRIDQDSLTERVSDGMVLAVRQYATAGGLTELIRRIDAAGRPAASKGARKNARSTLPADTSSFTGRRAELDRLLTGLHPAGDVVEISAIDGMAGVGKTAFAIHAAHTLAPFFPDDHLFVRLHGHSRTQQPVAPADALESLLLTVGVAPRRIPAGTDARAALWRSHMAGRQALLVLDDATGSDQVLPLLPGTGNCLVLITSRHHLAGLSDASSIPMDVLPPDEATDLFLRLAERPELRAGDGVVTELVELCGRLPLALSIAAGQLKHHHTWSAGDLKAELAEAVDRLSVLRAENRSVAATFDLTYRNLEADQQRLFRRLGLHPSPDIDAYAAAALDDSDLRATARRLDELYAYHMVDEVAWRRYRLHDLIRSHAQKLAVQDPDGGRPAPTIRLLDYYLYTAQAAGQSLTRNAPLPLSAPSVPRHAPDLTATEDAARWMADERLNLQAATEHAAARGHARHAVALPAAMATFLRDHGHWDQALTLHALAAATARTAGDRPGEAGALNALGAVQLLRGRYEDARQSLWAALTVSADAGDAYGKAAAHAAIAAYHQALSDYPNALVAAGQARRLYADAHDRRSEAEIHAYLSGVRCHTADYTQAEENATAALQIQREIGDRRGEAEALRRLAIVQLLTGRTHDAVCSALEALDIGNDVWDPPGMADSFDLLTRCYRPLGLLPNAEQDAARALKLRQDIGDRRGEADSRHETALNHVRLGAYETAISEANRALDIRRDIGDRSGEAGLLTELGEVCRLTANYTEAGRHLEQAWEIRVEIGDRYGAAACLTELGRVAYALSRYEKAFELFREALRIRRAIGDRNGEAALLSEISLTDWRTTQYARALANAREALRIRQKITNPDGEAQALVNIAQVLRRQGRYGDALRHTEQALDIRRGIGDRRGEAEALEIIALILRRQHRYDVAEQCAVEALGIRQEIRDRRGEAEALDALARVKRDIGEKTANDGDPEAGLRLLGEAGAYAGRSYKIRKKIKDRRGLGDALHTMATTERVRWLLTREPAHLNRAVAHAGGSLRITQDVHDRYGESAAFDTLAKVHLAAGDLDRALAAAEGALAANVSVTDRFKQAKAHEMLGLVHDARGDDDDARRAREAARAIWAETDTVGHLTDIDDELGHSR